MGERGLPLRGRSIESGFMNLHGEFGDPVVFISAMLNSNGKLAEAFEGIRSQVRECHDCREHVPMSDPMIVVDISDVRESVSATLAAFVSREEVIGTCGHTVTITSQLHFFDRDVFICLRRASSRDRTAGVGSHSVRLDRIQVSDTVYELTGFIEEEPSHFTCTVRSGGRWWRIDDAVVTPSAFDGSSSTAYVLRY